jgi:hypothetical protein
MEATGDSKLNSILLKKPIWQNPQTVNFPQDPRLIQLKNQKPKISEIETFEELQKIVEKLPDNNLQADILADPETLKRNEILAIPQQNNEFIITYVSFVGGRFYLVTTNSNYREADEDGNYHGAASINSSSFISKDSFLEIVSFNGLKNLKMQKFQELINQKKPDQFGKFIEVEAQIPETQVPREKESLRKRTHNLANRILEKSAEKNQLKLEQSFE